MFGVLGKNNGFTGGLLAFQDYWEFEAAAQIRVPSAISDLPEMLRAGVRRHAAWKCIRDCMKTYSINDTLADLFERDHMRSELF